MLFPTSQAMLTCAMCLILLYSCVHLRSCLQTCFHHTFLHKGHVDYYLQLKKKKKKESENTDPALKGSQKGGYMNTSSWFSMLWCSIATTLVKTKYSLTIRETFMWMVTFELNLERWNSLVVSSMSPNRCLSSLRVLVFISFNFPVLLLIGS